MGDIAADLKGHALNIGAIAKAGESGGIEPEQLYPIADGFEIAYCALSDLADAIDAIINGQITRG